MGDGSSREPGTGFSRIGADFSGTLYMTVDVSCGVAVGSSVLPEILLEGSGMFSRT